MSKVILCVDDEEIVLTSLKAQLNTFFGHDYEIELAQSGEDALEIIEELKEDNIEVELIVSDFLMPGMNGDKFLIKAQELSPKAKKILLTGQANMQGVTDIINHGALYRYLSKPWEQTDLVVTAKEAIKSYENEKELEFYTKHLEELVSVKTQENQTYLEIVDKYLLASKSDLRGKITDVSEALCNISGYTKDELIGKNHSLLRHPDVDKKVYENLWKTVLAGDVWEGEMKNLKKDGGFYWVKARISPMFDASQNIVGYASIRVDITDKKIVDLLSITDALTKIFNRRHFNDIFEKEIARASISGEKIGFIMLDIDFFKQYNDTYGHGMGDEVLVKVSQVLKSSLGGNDNYPFRLGGEEFGAIICGTDIDKLTNITKTLKESIEALEIEHSSSLVSKYITASFGACLFSCGDNITSDKIYKYTDKLLYEVKDNGRNNYIVKEY